MGNYYENRATLPNATVILVLGIVSIVLCCCYGTGLICGLISLILANQAFKLYKANPEFYTESSYKNAKAGKICAIVGVSLSAMYVIIIIVSICIFGWETLNNEEMLQERLQELFQL